MAAMDYDLQLQKRLEMLKHEHSQLDLELESKMNADDGDEFSIQRLKKQKLYLKDQMSAILDQLNPDIIA